MWYHVNSNYYSHSFSLDSQHSFCSHEQTHTAHTFVKNKTSLNPSTRNRQLRLLPPDSKILQKTRPSSSNDTPANLPGKDRIRSRWYERLGKSPNHGHKLRGGIRYLPMSPGREPFPASRTERDRPLGFRSNISLLFRARLLGGLSPRNATQAHDQHFRNASIGVLLAFGKKYSPQSKFSWTSQLRRLHLQPGAHGTHQNRSRGWPSKLPALLRLSAKVVRGHSQPYRPQWRRYLGSFLETGIPTIFLWPLPEERPSQTGIVSKTRR